MAMKKVCIPPRRWLSFDPDKENEHRPQNNHDEVGLVSIEQAIEPIVSLVPDVKQNIRLGKKLLKKRNDVLSLDEILAIWLYTTESESREKSIYYLLNQSLRQGDPAAVQVWLPYNKLLTTALNRLPSHATTVYRGIKTDLYQEYSKGKIIPWLGFTSCTKSIEVLQSEQFLGTTGTRMMFIIDCINGKYIQPYSAVQDEEEILLMDGTKLEVISFLDQGNDLRTVQLREISSDSTRLPVIISENAGHSKIQRQIDRLKSGSNIHLSGVKLDEYCVRSLVRDGLVRKQSIGLYMKETNLTANSATIIAEELITNRTLKDFHAFHNHIGDEGVRAIARSLSLNEHSTLTCLNLGDNGITDEGAQHLAEMLKNNKSLKELWLPWNRIGDEGVAAMALVIKTMNRTLKILSLIWNQPITDESRDPLKQLLTINHSLEELDLSNCNLSNATKTDLRRIAKLKSRFKLSI